MKVLLKKSTEDMNWGGDDYDVITLNPISKALTDCYLPQWSPSPLKAMLLKRLGTVKRMYLHLRVDCEKDSSVVKCLMEYFQSIGYKNMQCTGDEDIVNFVQRLEQDVPLAKVYFEIDENKSYE